MLTHHKENILKAAMPIILLMIRFKNSLNCQNFDSINSSAIKYLKVFSLRLQQASIPTKKIISASYCICAAFDEFILATNWGENSVWANQTLLSRIHKESSGGERFYIILQQMAENPAENIDILELLYFLLSIGFEGKFFQENKSYRDEIRYDLFNIIKNYRSSPPQYLSPCATDPRVNEFHSQKRISLKKFVRVAAGIILATTIALNIMLLNHADSLITNLNHISLTNTNTIATGNHQ